MERKQEDGTYHRITQGRLYDHAKARDQEDQATRKLADTIEDAIESALSRHAANAGSEPMAVNHLAGAIVHHNETLNGVEIAFTSKPDAQTLEALNQSTFRFSRRAKVWYAKWSPAKWAEAHRLAGLPVPAESKAS